MATAVLNRHGFAEGTSVSAWPAQNSVNGGPPAGPSVATAAVTSGVLTFTGLTVGVRYIAYAAGRGVQFRADEVLGTDSASPGTPDRRRLEFAEEIVGTGAIGARVTSVEGDIAVTQEAVPSLKDPAFGARGAGGDSITEDTAAITAWNASAAKRVIVPPGDYRPSTQLVLTNGRRLEGAGAPLRWRNAEANWATVIRYSGAEAAVKAQPAAGANRESFELVGLHFDGANAGAAVDGLLLDGSATPGDVYVEGALVDRCAFTNFGRHQIKMLGQVFDVVYHRVAANNAGRAADDIVKGYVAGGVTSPSQILFDDCWLAQYTPNKWCALDEGAVQSTWRFRDGDLVPYVNANPGANGVSKVAGGLQVIGTHIEGLGTDKTQVGIRYAGTLGALLLPSYCGLLSRGVEIGDPNAKANKARSAIIGGTATGNLTDIHIHHTGSRRGTVILPCGESGDTPPIVVDERLSNDGIAEVLNLSGSSAAWPNAQIFSPPIQLSGFNGDGHIEFKEQAVATPAPAANRARLTCADNGAGKTRMGVVFPSGAIQWFATEP